MTDASQLFEMAPYVVRIGMTLEAVPRNIYEVYNTQTQMVENRQEVLANAIRACRVMATQLDEELNKPQDIQWENDSGEEGYTGAG